MKSKKLLAGILSAAMVLCTMVFPAFADNTANVAKIGNIEYQTLADAVAAAQYGDTITLLDNSNGDGIVIPSGSNITIDFGGHTYTVDGTLVGSPRYETNCFQLLKDSDVIFKNGKIVSSKLAKWGANTPNANNYTGANIIVQNYSNLTLNNMTIDGDQSAQTEGNASPAYGRYVLSNNNGNTVLTGTTTIIAADGNYAFDVFRYSSYPSVTVTLDENMTGTIHGDIEISNTNNEIIADNSKFNLIIKNGNVEGSIKDARYDAQKTAYPKIGAISGGTFSTNVSAYCAPGYSVTTSDDNTFTVSDFKWDTATDSGFYMNGDTKFGMMRFLFRAYPSGTVKKIGIKYIKTSSSALSADKAVSVETDQKAVQGDIIEILAGNSNKYYAAAFIETTDGKITWSTPIDCSVNWNKQFTGYNGGTN